MKPTERPGRLRPAVRRKTSFHPSLGRLEPRVVPASLQPTVLDQWWLERINDERERLGASQPKNPSYQPLALAPEAKMVARNSPTEGAKIASQIKVDLRRVARFQEQNSIVFLNGQGLVEGPIDPYAASIARLIATSGRNQRYARHSAIAVDVESLGQPFGEGGGELVAVRVITFRRRGGPSSVTGTVIRDQNGDGRYDPGEGLGGVKISARGRGATRSLDTGGYALNVRRGGRLVVTAAGGSLATPLTRRIRVPRGQNVRITFLAT